MTVLLSGYDKTTQVLAFRVYAAEFPDPGRRQNYRRAHLETLDLLSAGLAQDFGVRHARIAREGLEKPQLLLEKLHMNLTHCRGLAAACIARFPVGLDAEAPRVCREAMLPRLCAEAECAQILAAEDKNFAFTRFWTLKESYGKYTGAGIRADLKALPFTLEPDVCGLFPAAENLMFFQMLLQKQYAVSLCVPAGAYTLEWAPEWALCGETTQRRIPYADH